MAGQGRLARPRFDVPDFDGFVIRAAGEDVGILGVESHATHEIAAQKHQINTNLQKKAFYTRGWDVPVPGQGRLTRP